MDDVINSGSGTREIGDIEVVIRNKRTGEVKYHEVLPVFEEIDD